MMKRFFILWFIFLVPAFLFSEEYILIKGKANSYDEFKKKYIKIKNFSKFSKKYKIIKNNYHKFINKNFFSSILPDPYEKDQKWLEIINAKDFDKISTGKGILIGVLDSGVEINHEDLKGQIIDYFNVADNNTDVTDYIGHGTSVTGIMGAIAHNGNGIIGLSPEAKYIVVKIAHGGDFSFDDYSVAEGIFYLVDKGCKIINMSIQMNQESEVIEDAIEYAKNKGVILVAASGNGGLDKESYPASNDYVLSVASVNENLEISNFSNFDNKTFIFAPGENILTTYIGNSYIKQTGTSFSAPMLTALIADILSLNKFLKYEDIKKIVSFLTEKKVLNYFKLLDVNNSLKSTGIRIITNGIFFSNGSKLTLSAIFPPTGINVNLYFGFITPNYEAFILNGNKWIKIEDNLIPTCSGIYFNDFNEYQIFGDNGIFPTIILDNVPSGVYKFCGIYEKNNNFLGWLNCRNVIVIGK